VLSSATLRAVPGQVRALFGRNGAGKSTLLKIAAGWHQPDSGCVRWEGTAHLRVTLAELAGRGLFYLPDQDLLSSAFTLRSQLDMIRRRRGGGDMARAAAVVGVEGCLDRRPNELSGGERRRAELAAILVARPRCVLADEPYRGIAPVDAEVITVVLRDLAARGTAIVVTGHETGTLLDAADHVTWCTSGTTYELGSAAEARMHDGFRTEYLGR